MKSFVWLGLALGLLAGHAGAQPYAPIVVPMVQNGACGSPPCKAIPNASGAPFFTSDTTAQSTLTQLLNAINAGITVNLNGVSTLAAQTTGNTTLGNILSAMPAKNGDGGALVHVTNPPSDPATGTNQTNAQTSLTTIATAQGAQGTGSTFNPPSGGSGILGYLSGIYKAITGTLTVGLPSNAAQETGGNLAAAAGSTSTTATNTGNVATNTGAISAAAGTAGDAAYSGSGNSTIIAALKGIYAALKGTLTISGAVTTTPSGGTVPAPYKFTPAAPDIATITTGGTAVNAFSSGHCSGGCIIVNPKGATNDLCVNGITTASGTTTAGALICIPPGQQFGFTPRATAISAVSSDSAHAFGGEGYQ